MANAVQKLGGGDQLTPGTLRAGFKRAFQAPSPYLAFFEIYGLIQDVTKPSAKNHDDFYLRAGRALAEQARREQICMELIIGAHSDLDLLIRRIRNTMLGAESASRPRVIKGIRLTFIRSLDGSFKNLTLSLIDALFDRLEKESDVDRLISGIDFCGIECPQKPQPVLDAIDHIYSRNRHRISRRRVQLGISVHAGEDLSRSAPTDQLGFMEKLVTRSRCPQTIAHGTILWIPPGNFHLGHDQLRQREDCIKLMAKKGISLEICPTANLRMTPLIRRGDIPILHLKSSGIHVRVGSDNPVLLCTTMQRELGYLRRHI